MKRFLSIALTIIFLFMSFASCSKQEDDIQETPSAETTTTTHEHVWGNQTTVKRPTCVEEGLVRRTCECGATEDTVTPALNTHQYSDRKCRYCGADLASINSISLDKFVIVYADDGFSEAAALKICELIKKDMGYELTIKTQTDAESEYEILVGNLPRALSNNFYSKDDTYKSENFEIKVSGKKMAFCAKDAKKMELLIEKFEERFLSSANMVLTDENIYLGNIYNIDSRVSQTDIRIMSNNVYLFGSISDRKDLLLSSFEKMDADVLLLQEMSAEWHDAIDTPLSDRGYTLVPTSNKHVRNITARDNYTPIYYRSDKMTLIDYGYNQYSSVKLEPDQHLSPSKSYTWALLEDKTSGKQFCAISTHFTWAPNDFVPSPDELRQSDARDLTNFVKSLKEKYGKALPIFLMGDLNCAPNSKPLSIVSTEFKEVRTNSSLKYTNNTSYSTAHSLGASPAKDVSSIIDHALMSGSGFSAIQYQHIVNYLSLASTDHVPLLLDIDFS